MNRRLTAFVERECDRYVALCPEVDIASQGDTVAEARDNLAEALVRPPPQAKSTGACMAAST